MPTESASSNPRAQLSWLLWSVAGVSVLLVMGLLSVAVTDTGDGGDAGAGGTALAGGVMTFIAVSAFTFGTSSRSMWFAAAAGPVLGFLAAAGLITLAQNATIGALFLLLSLVAGPVPLTLATGLIAVGVMLSRRPDA